MKLKLFYFWVINFIMDIFERIENNPGPLGEYATYADGEYIFPQLEGEISTKMFFKGQEMIVFSSTIILVLPIIPKSEK